MITPSNLLHTIRLLLISLFFIQSFTPLSAAEEVTIHQNSFRTTYETVTLPDDETMGFMGVNYLFNNEYGFYYGLGFYGSMSGERGGLFTFGIEGGYQYHLLDNVILDAGAFVGGGGGGRAISGDGLMLRPHAGLLYDAKDYQIGVTLSKVKFPGVFDSNQVGVQLDIPFQSLTTSASDKDSIYQGLLEYSDHYNFGWVDYYFAATFQQYFPMDNARNDSGQKLTKTISLVGAEAGKYFNPRWFAYLDTAGAASGDVGGYMDVFGGLGYDWHLGRHFGFKTKVALGSGGGGHVDTGGGFMYKANVGAYFSPVKELDLNVEAGYMDAPTGNFSATTAKVSLAFHIDVLGIGSNIRHVDAYKSTSSSKWQARLVTKRYMPSTNLRDNKEDDPIDLIGFKLDRFVTKNFYLTGQSDWAYTGYVGGYATGLLGVGYNTDPIFNRLSAYAELLVGAGAGGGVATKGGALAQPMAGLTYKINKQLSFQVGVGRIKAKSGTLDTTVVDAGMVYKFRTIEH